MPNYSWTIFSLSIGAIIAFLSTAPLELPPIDDFGLSIDKLAHSFAYFVLATSLGLSLDLDWKIVKNKKIVFYTVFLFGLILELIQGFILVYRSFEAYDLVANTSGIILYFLFVKTLKKIVVKSRIFLN